MKKQKLSIWFIKAAEELPKENNYHLGRIGALAKYLSKQGHTIVWWKSSYYHGCKRYICNRYRKLCINKHEKVILLHSRISYKKNISLRRIVYYKLLAREFKRHYNEEPTPDVIFCAWPTAEFAQAAVNYGKKHHIPVILDIRDYWPDIFVRAFPHIFQSISRILLTPMKWKAAKIMQQAYAITGVTDYAVLWGCTYARRKPQARDRAFFIGCEQIEDIETLKCNIPIEWEKQGVNSTTWNICFISSLRSQGMDLETCISSVINLSKKYPNIRLTIAGDGDSKEKFEKLASNSKNIIFLGWQNDKGMNTLMSISKCGLYCLQNTEDFINTFSNKAIQYLSAGLPIINSLNGFAKTLLSDTGAGLSYKEGNVDDCMRQIEKLYLNEEKRAKMAVNAKKLFNTKFDANIINKQMEAYFYEIVENYKQG